MSSNPVTRRCAHLVICALMLLISCSVAAMAPLVLDSRSSAQSFDGVLEYAEDTEGRWPPEQAVGAPDWQPAAPGTFNMSYSASAWWLRMRVHHPGASPARRLLVIDYPVLDDVQIHVLDHGRIIDTFRLGDKQPFNERPIHHQGFIIPLDWQPDQTLTLLIRVQTSSAVQVPLTLWDEHQWLAQDGPTTLIHGLFFGSMLVIAAYNLLIFFVLRERTYALYVGYVVCMPLFLASLGGYSFRYLWPEATRWNDQAIIVFLAGAMLFGTAFTQRFLRVARYAPRSDLILTLFVGVGILLGASAFLLPYQPAIRATIIAAALACLVCLWVGIYGWIQGRGIARYYTIAWATMLAGGITLALSKVGWLPSNALTRYATHLGTLIEAILLSFALMDRINKERRLRFKAQEEALNTARAANEALEWRVQERTRELESLTARLRDLSNTDPLTGLANRRRLDEVLTEEWKRARRYGHPIAVVLFDIDHFKRVNDTHGHGVGDECLRAVAAQLRSALRTPADLPARLGGEEFCIILPETDAVGARVVAERVREAIAIQPLPTSVGALTVTLSAGVHASIPDPGTNPDMLLEPADQALYDAKRQGRNRVVVVDDALPSASPTVSGVHHAASDSPSSDRRP